MSYASLQEIWPDFLHSDKFQKYANTLPQKIVSELIENSSVRGGNKYTKKIQKTDDQKPQPVVYEQSRDYPIQKVNVEKFSNVEYGKYHSECSSILKHLSQCEKCRQFVKQKFAPSRPIHKEEEEEEENDEYLDLAIYVITGIFILFLLDMLLKFTKKKG